MSNLKGKAILVIEDCQETADAIKEYFEGKGIKVHLGSTFEKAKDILYTKHIDHIVCDFTIRRETAFSFLSDLESASLHIPNFLLITGNINLRKNDLEKHNVENILYKPFAMSELEKILLGFAGEEVGAEDVFNTHSFESDEFEVLVDLGVKRVGGTLLEFTEESLIINVSEDISSSDEVKRVVVTLKEGKNSLKVEASGKLGNIEVISPGETTFFFDIDKKDQGHFKSIIENRRSKQKEISDYLKKSKGVA